MTLKITTCFLLLCIFFGCSSHQEPHALYNAPFNPQVETIDGVVWFIYNIAEKLCIFFSCSSYQEPHAHYNAPFDPQVETIDGVVRFIYDIADKWNLEPEQEDRGSAKFLSSGVDAFNIFLHIEGDVIILIGNIGSGTRLSLMVFDDGHLPVVELDRLTEEIKGGLEKRFGLEFCAQDPYTSLCEE